MKKCYLIKKMILILSLLIMAQTNFQYVIMTKAMVSLLNLQTPFQSKFKTPIKKHNKSLHQQSLLLKDTYIISDDEDHIYTRIPEDSTLFALDTTITSKTFLQSQTQSLILTLQMQLKQNNLSNVQHNVHKSIHFMTHHF